MSRQLGNIALGQTLTFLFPTENPNGVPVAPTTPGAVYVYKDDNAAETDTGVTYTPSFDGVDGVNLVKVETDDAFYAGGHNYTVVLIGAVIPGVLGFGPATVNTVLAEFSIENRQTAAVDTDGSRLGTAANQTSIINAVNAITTNTARSMPVIPVRFVRPLDGSTTYQLMLYLYTLQGNLEDADSSTVTIHARTAGGTSRDSNLDSTTMTKLAAGKYAIDYDVADDHAQESVYFDFTWDIDSTGMADSGVAEVCDAEDLATLAAINAKTTKLTFDDNNNVKSSPQTASVLPTIDGLDPEKVLAAVLATAAGKVTVTDNGDGTYTATFKRQDGSTTALSVTYNPATGTRAATAVIP